MHILVTGAAGLFRDGWSLQMATVTGNVAKGFTASLVVRV